MDKNDIFSNIDDFSAEQLFEFINQGIVTLEDLRHTGDLDATKRNAITTLQKNREQEEDNAWNNAQEKNTVLSYSEYLDKYPNGKYILDAKNKISHLEDDNAWNNAQIKNTINSYKEYLDKYPNGEYTLEAKDKISQLEADANELEEVLKNPSAFPADTIRNYLSDGLLTPEILIQNGIPKEVIDILIKNDKGTSLKLGDTPPSIPSGFTEVYFWGIRGSGKTTALAAVLSTAHKKGLLEVSQSKGYGYTLQLQDVFDKNTTFLPGPTPVEKTQYLPFTLKEKDETYARSVSLIELSGEIFQCFLKKNTGDKLTDQQEITFNTLINYLKGDNRKMHFFFVDYSRGNNKDLNEYRQAQYLNGAAVFFNNPEYNIFGKTTDAVYLVVTKSDLIPKESKSKKLQIYEYLNSSDYVGLVNSLRDKCKKHHINDERILGTPFSLGTVYFEEICQFNPETAENIIDILMRRIPTNEKNILDVFNK
nr:hypothetical protein [uncultured Flavobacterium sp.]